MPQSMLTHADLVNVSIDVILSNQSDSGAYQASPTFSAYKGYSWFRDGAFIAEGISSAGQADSASSFFDWCQMTLVKHRGAVERIVAASNAGTPVPDEQMLPTRFTHDGDFGIDDWWDFQLDGYGTWLWAVCEHSARHGVELDRWRIGMELTVDYLVASWDRPCFDWWEEHAEHIHLSTLGCIGAGLKAAATSGVLDAKRATAALATADEIHALIMRDGLVDGHLTKWIGSAELDGSLAALIAPMQFIDPHTDVARATIDALDAQLEHDGGVYRYLDDVFYGGGRWPLLTCFLGLAKHAMGDAEGARNALEWVASTASENGVLPEQVDGHLLAPEHRQEWIDRWGPVAQPLLWSHAMFLRLDQEINAS